jgi:hypothetical protein
MLKKIFLTIFLGVLTMGTAISAEKLPVSGKPSLEIVFESSAKRGENDVDLTAYLRNKGTQPAQIILDPYFISKFMLSVSVKDENGNIIKEKINADTGKYTPWPSDLKAVNLKPGEREILTTWMYTDEIGFAYDLGNNNWDLSSYKRKRVMIFVDYVLTDELAAGILEQYKIPMDPIEIKSQGFKVKLGDDSQKAEEPEETLEL